MWFAERCKGNHKGTKGFREFSGDSVSLKLPSLSHAYGVNTGKWPSPQSPLSMNLIWWLFLPVLWLLWGQAISNVQNSCCFNDANSSASQLGKRPWFPSFLPISVSLSQYHLENKICSFFWSLVAIYSQCSIKIWPNPPHYDPSFEANCLSQTYLTYLKWWGNFSIKTQPELSVQLVWWMPGLQIPFTKLLLKFKGEKMHESSSPDYN